MKQLWIIIITFLLTQNIQAKTVLLTVNGLVCSFCGQGIEKKISTDPRVQAVTVDLKNKKVSIELKPNQTISDAELNNLLKDAGYSISHIETN